MNVLANVPETTEAQAAFTTDALLLDAGKEVDRIGDAIRAQVLRQLRRRGVVLGLSGGIDSSVTAALCVKALGANSVVALLMPEHDSDPDSLRLGRQLAGTLGITHLVEDITPILTAAGCYERRDDFVRRLVPEYGDGWGCKIVLSNSAGYNVSMLVVQSPDGRQHKMRMPIEIYFGIVAAANMKQRTRKQIEYYHADRLNFAVAGTPNRLELDQGFFVKNGDGAADLKPIAHLYKTQVYQLADYLELPDEIRTRPPTTDTWSLAQTQEEFYFTVPYAQMDLCLYGYNNGVAAELVAQAAGLSVDRVHAVWDGIQSKRRAARYLHEAALTVEPTLGKDAH